MKSENEELFYRIDENVKNIKEDIIQINLNLEKHNKFINKIDRRVLALELQQKGNTTIVKKQWYKDPGIWSAIIAGIAISVYLIFRMVFVKG